MRATRLHVWACGHSSGAGSAGRGEVKGQREAADRANLSDQLPNQTNAIQTSRQTNSAAPESRHRAHELDTNRAKARQPSLLGSDASASPYSSCFPALLVARARGAPPSHTPRSIRQARSKYKTAVRQLSTHGQHNTTVLPTTPPSSSC